MKKIMFGFQIAVMILAFPVYFYVEINREPSVPMTASQSNAAMKKAERLTKNGLEKPVGSVLPGSVLTNTVFINSFY